MRKLTEREKNDIHLATDDIYKQVLPYVIGYESDFIRGLVADVLAKRRTLREKGSPWPLFVGGLIIGALCAAMAMAGYQIRGLMP